MGFFALIWVIGIVDFGCYNAAMQSMLQCIESITHMNQYIIEFVHQIFKNEILM